MVPACVLDAYRRRGPALHADRAEVEEQTKIKAESQKELENVMPAADVEEIMSSGDGGWGGRSRRR